VRARLFVLILLLESESVRVVYFEGKELLQLFEVNPLWRKKSSEGSFVRIVISERKKCSLPRRKGSCSLPRRKGKRLLSC